MRTILAVAVLAIAAAPASAGTIGFQNITNNNAGDADIGELQLCMDVVDLGAGLAEFIIYNTGPEASVVGQIYFDGDIFTDLFEINNDPPGVEFSEGASPPDLPGGNTVSFDADYSAGADSPAPQNGVGPNEQVGIEMNYAGTFADLEAALASGDLRVGLHVIAFASGGSESFVNEPVVPAPGALALLGLAGLAGRRRRR